MPILGILASNSKPYSLLQTYTSSGTWTVPADITAISVVLLGGGGFAASGESSSIYGGEGGYGGGGSAAIAFRDYSVVPGSTYTVAVGSSESASTISIGDFTLANSGFGTGRFYVNGWSNVPNAVSINGRNGGLGGFRKTSTGAGNAGSPGASALTSTINLKGLGDVSFSSGAGGPGGGSGAYSRGTSGTTYSGGARATSGGSTSGGGGSAKAHPPLAGDASYPYNSSYPYGAGGPGGGGNGYAFSTIYGFEDFGFSSTGFPGNQGVVYIYGL